MSHHLEQASLPTHVIPAFAMLYKTLVEGPRLSALVRVPILSTEHVFTTAEKYALRLVTVLSQGGHH